MTEAERDPDRGRGVGERDRGVATARDGPTRRADDPASDDRVLGGGGDARTGPRAGSEREAIPEAHDAYYVTDPGDTEVH